MLHNIRDEFASSLFPFHRPTDIRWARWRPHRFCGMEAATEGRFTIPVLYRQNDQLRVNYRCKPGGWITIELLKQTPSMFHPDLDPVDGFSFEENDRLTGDSLDKVVTWQGNSDISSVGEAVVIRVMMFQAKLFAYKV